MVIADPCDRGYQSIAAARHILDVSWLASGLAERNAELAHAEVQARIEVDVRVRPQALADLFTRDDGAAPFGEQVQQPRWLRR
jgi:hypothetical protein